MRTRRYWKQHASVQRMHMQRSCRRSKHMHPRMLTWRHCVLHTLRWQTQRRWPGSSCGLCMHKGSWIVQGWRQREWQHPGGGATRMLLPVAGTMMRSWCDCQSRLLSSGAMSHVRLGTTFTISVPEPTSSPAACWESSTRNGGQTVLPCSLVQVQAGFQGTAEACLGTLCNQHTCQHAQGPADRRCMPHAQRAHCQTLLASLAHGLGTYSCREGHADAG